MPEYAPGTPSWIDLGSPDHGIAGVMDMGDIFPAEVPAGFAVIRLAEAQA